MGFGVGRGGVTLVDCARGGGVARAATRPPRLWLGLGFGVGLGVGFGVGFGVGSGVGAGLTVTDPPPSSASWRFSSEARN